MLRFAILVLIMTIVVAAIFGLYPELDLRISSLFFDSHSQTFPLAKQPVLIWARRESMLIVDSLAISLFGLLLGNLVVRPAGILVSSRVAIYLLLVFLLGPGLLVNGVTKELSHRPRPVSVTNFGGHQNFVPWSDWSGECKRNCSFASGESATAGWTLTAALLVPGPWQVPAVVGSVALTVATAALRLAFGGHFFSDVTLGALLTWLLALGLYPLVFHTRLLDKLDRAFPVHAEASLTSGNTAKLMILPFFISAFTYICGWRLGHDPDVGRDMAIYVVLWFFVFALLYSRRSQTNQSTLVGGASEGS